MDCRGRRLTKEYLLMWRGRPVDKLSWVPEDHIPDPVALRTDLTEDQPPDALSMPRWRFENKAPPGGRVIVE